MSTLREQPTAGDSVSTPGEPVTLEALDKRVKKLEDRPKDKWDKLGILSVLLVPFVVGYFGYLINSTLQQDKATAELGLQDARLKAEKEIADADRTVNVHVEQAKLIHDFTRLLGQAKDEETAIAIHALRLAIQDEQEFRQLLNSIKGRPGKETQQVIATLLGLKKHGDLCSGDSDCLSETCRAAPGRAEPRYCVARGFDCGYASQEGRKVGDTVKVASELYLCHAPLGSASATWTPVEERYFYTGEYGGRGRNAQDIHYPCYSDQTAPAAVCGKDRSVLSTIRVNSVNGNRCGYSYYVVRCRKP